MVPGGASSASKVQSITSFWYARSASFAFAPPFELSGCTKKLRSEKPTGKVWVESLLSLPWFGFQGLSSQIPIHGAKKVTSTKSTFDGATDLAKFTTVCRLAKKVGLRSSRLK